jgi:hypothetical protein
MKTVLCQQQTNMYTLHDHIVQYIKSYSSKTEDETKRSYRVDMK